MPIFKCNYRTFRFVKKDAEGKIIDGVSIEFHPCAEVDLAQLTEAEARATFAQTYGEGWIHEETFDRVHQVRVVLAPA